MFTLKSSLINNPGGTGNDFDNIENAPVYTMKKDIERAKNPQVLPENTINRTLNTPKNINGSQGNSPFFGSQEPARPVEKSFPTADASHFPGTKEAPIPVNSNRNFPGQRAVPPRREDLRLKEMPGEIKTSWGKIIFTAFSIFILLSIGLGGYYFWVTQSGFPSLFPKDTPAERMPSFSTRNPNYLIINTEKTDKDQIKALINEYAKKMIDDGVTSSVEFIVSDIKNSPVDFSVFEEKMGLSLPPEITSELDKNFSLFIYNDSGKPRLGLVVATQEGERLRKALMQEEPNLPRELQSIFLAGYSLEAKIFKNSSYNGIGIRYLNITSPEELSIDYTVSGNQLILGTSKMTFRSIIDYLNSSEKSPEPSDTQDSAASNG